MYSVYLWVFASASHYLSHPTSCSPAHLAGELKALPLRDFLTSHLPDAGEPASSSDGSRKGGAGKGAGEDEEPEAAIPTATLEDLVAFDEQVGDVSWHRVRFLNVLYLLHDAHTVARATD